MKKKLLTIAIVILLIVALVSGGMTLKKFLKLHQEQQTFQELKTTEEKTETRDSKSLYEKNADYYGWLTVDGTSIDYPVMYTPDDSDKYLHMDFNGDYSYSGTPFLDGRCDPDSSDQLIIYGHNMLNKTMFSTLSYFEEESFYEEHHTFSLKTRDGVKEYEVIAAVKTDIESGAEIYNFVSGTEEEFNEYVELIQSMSLYDTGVDAAYGRQLTVLTTCSYHTDDGRFLIVGVEK